MSEYFSPDGIWREPKLWFALVQRLRALRNVEKQRELGFINLRLAWATCRRRDGRYLADELPTLLTEERW